MLITYCFGKYYVQISKYIQNNIYSFCMANFKSEPNFTQNTRKEQNSAELWRIHYIKSLKGYSR